MLLYMYDIISQNHMFPLMDRAINWSFIYNPIEEKYCPDNRKSDIEPIILIKILSIQYLYGIRSMR